MDLNSIFSLIWLPVLIKYILLQLYWWQIKEYRLDRFKLHLQTTVGKRLFLNKDNVIKFIILILIPFFPYLALLLFTFYYGFYFFGVSKNYKQALSPRPKFTYRILIIGFLILIQTVLLSYGFWLYYSIYTIVVLTLLDLVSPVVVLLAVIVTDIVGKYFKQQKISLAAARIMAHPELIVIGVTGSYGKTTTKEFIGQLLSAKYQVIVTPEHVNTDIGIANFINQKLTKDVKVLVIEMGAYTKGEIKEICQMVKPTIGVITAIGTQHLALFGSQQNLIQAKLELIDALPKNGLAVLNAEYPELIKATTSHKIRKILYSTKSKTNIYATNIQSDPEFIKFNLIINQKKFSIKSPIVGIQNVQNILAAIAVALELKLKMTDIIKGIAQLKSPSSTMQVIKNNSGMTLIDDSYNINPQGVMLAIDSLAAYKNKQKIVVLSPMLELGSASLQSHRQVIEHAISKSDQVFWIGLDFSDIAMEFKKDFVKKIQVYKTTKEATAEFQKVLTKNAVILFEGKNAQGLLEVVK